LLRCPPLSTPPFLALASNQTRWWTLALLFVCRTGLGLQFQALGSVSDDLVASLGFGYAQIGTLIGLFMLPGLVLALPAGYLGRYLSDRVLVALAFMALAVGAGVAALAQGFGQLALGRLACGAGFVISTIYLTKMTADWFSGKELATAMGLLVMSWPLGIALGQVSQVWIAIHFGWRSVFVVAALYSALGALALLLLYRPQAASAPGQAAALGLPRHELRLTLLAATTWGLYNAGYIVFLSFAPRVLMAAGTGPAQASATVSLGSWVMIVSAFVGGRYADRSGRGAPLLYGCCLVGIAALLLMQHTALAAPLCVLFGLAGGAPAGVIMALTSQAMAPQRRAFGMGVFFSLFFVLMTLAPPLAGWLFDRSGNAFHALLFAALLFAATALSHALFGMLKRHAGGLRPSAAPPAA
jgi:predicted MFS family arabinose efflux permease